MLPAKHLLGVSYCILVRSVRTVVVPIASNVPVPILHFTFLGKRLDSLLAEGWITVVFLSQRNINRVMHQRSPNIPTNFSNR